MTREGRAASAQEEMRETGELIAPADNGEPGRSSRDDKIGELVEIEEEEEQEVASIPIAPGPCMPCNAEVEEHKITHIPYRS